MAAIHFSVVLGGLLVRRLVYSDTTFTFQQAMNQYGRLYVPLLALILLAEFFALVGVNSLVVFLSYASYMMFSVIFTFEILHTRVMRSGDTFYLMLAGSILAGATMLIGVLIAVLFSGGQLASFASSLF